MAEDKVALQLVNEKDTPLKELEGKLEIEYFYVGQEQPEKVVDEQIRGEFRTPDGKFPAPDAGKELEKEEVKFTPENNFFYEARSAVFKEQFLKKSDPKFALKTKKMSKEEKIAEKEAIKTRQRAILLDKLNKKVK